MDIINLIFWSIGIFLLGYVWVDKIGGEKILAQHINDLQDHKVDKDTSWINVMNHGVVHSLVIDNAAAINACFAAAGALVSGFYHPIVYFPPGVGFRVDSAVACPVGVNIKMDAPIIYYGADDITALTIGSAIERNREVDLNLHVLRDEQSDWLDEANIGIKLISPYDSRIRIIASERFTLGVQICTDGAPSGWNETFLGLLWNNKIGLDITGVTWCDENLFFGGKFWCTDGLKPGVDRFGVRIGGNSPDGMQRNIFLKPSFELINPGIPILIVRGDSNQFLNCRDDQNASPFMVVQNISKWNLAESGHKFTVEEVSIDNQGDYEDNFVTTQRGKHYEHSGMEIFNSGDLAKKACWYDATKIHVPNVHITRSTDATIYNSHSSLQLHEDYLYCHLRGVGVIINTENLKSFVLRRDTKSGNGGRAAIRCYDVNGDVLTNLDPNHPYVKTGWRPSFIWEADWGGTYSHNADSEEDMFFKVHEDVKKIAVLVRSGTTPLMINSFAVYAVHASPIKSRHASVWAGYEEVVIGSSIGSTSPTKGRGDLAGYIEEWQRGKTIYNATPSLGQPQGWVCVRGENSPANGGEPATETDWAVDDDQSAADGDIIGAVLDDDTIHWTSISGVPAGNVITVSAGVPAGRTIPDIHLLWGLAFKGLQIMY